ncbi:MAG: DUF960 domain-containing protein [Clostridia bacterium]|nr:DUF960 domain-containing protein [Clostridia bacterium]
MFDAGARLMTCGIAERLPNDISALLWSSVDTQLGVGLEMDYLQVFKFKKVDDLVLAIYHEQEEPERKTVIYTDYKAEYDALLTETVYIIDDGDHSTILFATEY